MSVRPKLFQDPKNALEGMANAIVQDTLREGAKQAVEQGKDVKLMPKYLEVTEQRMAKQGVIDLKPFFAKSAKRKINKQGEWYLYIPISIKTRDMSRRAYDELRAQSTPKIEGSKTNMYTKYLYDRRKESPSVQSINYNPKSKRITAIDKKWGKGTRREYVAFRTVNAKSPASSWIINRGKVNDDDMSKTMLDNIDRLMKWKIKNL